MSTLGFMFLFLLLVVGVGLIFAWLIGKYVDKKIFKRLEAERGSLQRERQTEEQRKYKQLSGFTSGFRATREAVSRSDQPRTQDISSDNRNKFSFQHPGSTVPNKRKFSFS